MLGRGGGEMKTHGRSWPKTNLVPGRKSLGQYESRMPIPTPPKHNNQKNARNIPNPRHLRRTIKILNNMPRQILPTPQIAQMIQAIEHLEFLEYARTHSQVSVSHSITVKFGLGVLDAVRIPTKRAQHLQVPKRNRLVHMCLGEYQVRVSGRRGRSPAQLESCRQYSQRGLS